MTTASTLPPSRDAEPGVPGDARRRYELLEDAREILISRLSGIVGKALDTMVEDLAAVAGKLKDADDKLALADAASLVRQHRGDIEQRFRRSFSEVFERRLFDKAGPAAGPAEPRELSLVDDAVVSQRIEEDRRVNRARGKLDPDEVLGMRARLAALLEREWFDEAKHPAAPEAVFEALDGALGGVTPRPDVRAALMDAFEPHVCANLNQVYALVNERLKARQVLPKIRPQVAVARSGRMSDDPRGGRGGSTASAPGIAGAPGQQEPGQGRPGAGATTATAGGYWGGAPGGAGQGASGSRAGTPGEGARSANTGGPGGARGARTQPTAQDVDAVLVQLSQGAPAARATAARMLSDPATFAVADLPIPAPGEHLIDALTGMQGASEGVGPAPSGVGLLADLAERVRDKGSPLDQLTVEIVSMVFDYIYADKRITDVVKQQLLRLQVVAVKAALIDRSFFARRQHPMRRLIDRISELASDPDNDFSAQGPLVAGLETAVERVLLDFDQDLAIFDQARERIEALAADESARAAQRIAQVTRDAQRAEDVAQARTQARALLNDRIDPDTPAFVREFVDEWWSVVLAQAQVSAQAVAQAAAKTGAQEAVAANTQAAPGPELTPDEAIAIAESLVWSVAPKFPEDVPRLAGLLPRLISGLMRGAKIAGIPDDLRQAFFDALMKTHTQAIAAARQNASAALKRASNLRMRADGRIQFTPGVVPVPPVAAEDDGGDERLGLPPDLKRGDFIELDTPEGPRAFKLSWISPAHRLFVLSRFPEDARSLERSVLAELFGTGRARVVGERSPVQDAIATLSTPAEPAAAES